MSNKQSFHNFLRVVTEKKLSNGIRFLTISYKLPFSPPVLMGKTFVFVLTGLVVFDFERAQPAELDELSSSPSFSL